MPGMTTTRLPNTDHCLTINRDITPNGKRSGKKVIANYTTSIIALKSAKVLKTVMPT